MIRRAVVLAVAVVALAGCADTKIRPNLVIVTLDTTRADHFGFTGHEAAHTPNFDSFAADRAVWFGNAITAVPVTLPSHATIMTGTYPVFHGVHDNDGYVLDDGVTTLAEILKAEGFTTGAVLAAFPLDSEVNLDQGFDHYDDDFQSDWTATERAARGPFSFGFLERKADRVNLAVGRWLEDNWRERFYLWIHYFDPHQPYDPPPPYRSMFAAEPYDGEIAFLDENFGRLLEMFEERDLLSNTIIVVVGDHGEALEEHGEPTHAHFVYDATVRVPLLVAVPNDRFRPGTQVTSQVRTADIAPTILDLLGLPRQSEMQGTSLVPLLEEPTLEWSTPALVETYYNKFHFGWAPLRSIRTDDVKFIEAPTPELYDLSEDPTELTNLAPSNPHRITELRTQLQNLVRANESPDMGRSTAVEIDSETVEKLEALGYLGGGSTMSERAAPFPSIDELAIMTDPKDMTTILRYTNFIHEMMRARRFDDAIPVIRNALDADPGNAKLWVFLAGTQASLGRWDEALEATEKAQAIQPENAEAYSIAGQIHILRGEHELAVEPLLRAVELYPQHAETLQKLAATYLTLGRHEEAITHFEAALELDDSRWQVLADLATAYSQADRWSNAQETLQRALDLNPYSSDLRYHIAVFYRQAGNPDFSRQMLGETLRISPDHLAANTDLGELLLAEGKVDAARSHLERVVELAPASAPGLRAERALAQAGAADPPPVD